MTLDRLWIWIAIALPALIALLVPLPTVDLAYQVRAGNEILGSGALPAVDTWTFTVAGTPWVDQQWLAQVWLAVGYEIGGWELLAVVRAGLVAALTGLLMATARERGATPRTAAILAMAAFALAAPALALRPQLFGIVLFAVLLWLVAVRDRHPRMYWLAPVALLLWANVHGSFVLGPVILGYAWLRDLAARRSGRTSFAVFIGGSLATLVNPHAVGAWVYAAGIGANPVIATQVSEWQRTSLFAMPGTLFYAAVAMTAVLALRRRSALRWPDWVLLLAMVAMGAWAVRGVAWWAPVMVLVLGGVLARRSGTPVSERPGSVRLGRLNLVVAVAVGFLVLSLSRGGVHRIPSPGVSGSWPTRPAASSPRWRSWRCPARASWFRRPGAHGSNGERRTPATSSTPASSCSRPPSGRMRRRWRLAGIALSPCSARWGFR